MTIKLIPYFAYLIIILLNITYLLYMNLKKRVILSLNVSDKIINHYFTRYVLEKKLDKYLDIRNVASRKGYGVSYGRKLLNKYNFIDK